MNTYDFTARTLHGVDVRLSQYLGHPLLIVNVAGQCGFTPQIHMLFGAPQVILILHGEPAFRGSSQRP